MRREKPDRALAENVAPQATHREIGRHRANVLVVAGVNIQDSNRESAGAAGHTRAAANRHSLSALQTDTAAEEEHRRQVRGLGPRAARPPRSRSASTAARSADPRAL